MATLEQIQVKLKKLQAQAETLLARKSQAAIDEIRSLMEKHGLTAADIDTPTAGKKRGPKPVAKSVGVAKTSAVQYQDLKTGATWSGRGRAPGWIAKARDRSRFLVGDSAISPVPVSASKPKAAGNYVRGVQPEKYRDPKSGATWSGRGRAPAWIAEAKDRNKFLIDGATGGAKTVASTAASKSATGKVAAKKSKTASPKVVAKKTVTKRVSAKAAVATNAKAEEQVVPAEKRVVVTAKKAAVKKVSSKKASPNKPVVKRAAAKKALVPKAPDAAVVAPATAETPELQSAE
jgi:DNA-binding protein H-NS